MFFFTSIFKGFLSQLGWIWGSKLGFQKQIPDDFFSYSCPRAPQERPKSAQERSKNAPKAPQERPRASQERPRAPQEPFRSAQRRPREPSGYHFEASELGGSDLRRRSVARLVRAARSERFSVKLRVARTSVDMRETYKNLCFSLVFLRFL